MKVQIIRTDQGIRFNFEDRYNEVPAHLDKQTCFAFIETLKLAIEGRLDSFELDLQEIFEFPSSGIASVFVNGQNVGKIPVTLEKPPKEDEKPPDGTCYCPMCQTNRLGFPKGSG